MPITKVYEGKFSYRKSRVVTVNGHPLDPCWHIKPPAETIFYWGSVIFGSTARLALALSIDLFGEQTGLEMWHSLQREVIDHLPRDEAWVCTDLDIFLAFGENQDLKDLRPRLFPQFTQKKEKASS